MSDYTIVNLREVEDVAPRFGMPDGMHARFPKRELGSERVAVSLQALEAGTRIPFGHRHPDQEELYVILSGSGRVKLDDEILDVRAWDVVRVAPGVMRNFEAGPEGLELLAMGGPLGDEPEMVPGWWSDEEEG